MGESGDNMLIGQFQHNLDEKNRLVIPTKYREALGKEFIVTRGIENCLYVYPTNEWNKVVAKLNSLPFTKKDARTFVRSLFSGATDASLDKSGRIVISESQASYAFLKKECMIIGVNDRLEIWALDEFNNYINNNSETLSDIAEHLFEVNDAL